MKLVTYKMLERLQGMGISNEDAVALRRISMTLQRWFELECGDGTSWVERDETTGKPFRYYEGRYLDPKPRRYAVADRETGALKRLEEIMARYPELAAYVQGDPRGASLYIYRRDEQRLMNYEINAIYSSSGTAVYK